MNQPVEALSACRKGLSFYPDDAELQYLHGSLLLDHGELAGAEAVLLRLLGSKEADHFASIATGLQGHRTRFLLSMVYHRQGRVAEEEAHLRAALNEDPTHAPAASAYGELLLNQMRWPELHDLAARLDTEPSTRLVGRVLQGRALLARKEFGAARTLLEATVAEYPRELWPLVILSHVLLQEGRDLPSAERILRHILALEPANEGVKHNLMVLLMALGKAPAA